MTTRGAGSSNAFDQALKLLGEQWPADLARLLYPGAQLDEPLPGELPVAERRADWLWRAHVDGEPCVLHIEFQLRAKPDLAERMFTYASRIYTQYHLPPAGVLVHLIQVPHPALSPFRVTVAERDVLRYEFQVVKLWELDPAPLLGGPPTGLLPLVPLMRGATPEQVPQLAQRLAQLPQSTSLQRGDLLGILKTLSTLRFPKADIWTLLRRNSTMSELLDELIEDSPFLRQLHQEAVAEGEAKGRAEGEAKGEAMGRLSGLRASVRDIVQARFAAISAEELAGVDTIEDAERLHALIAALASAPDVAAARRALADALG